MEDCAYLVFLILSWSSGVKRCVRRVDFDEFRRVSGLLRSMGKRMGLNKRRTHHFSTQSSPSRWRISSKTYNSNQPASVHVPQQRKTTRTPIAPFFANQLRFLEQLNLSCKATANTDSLLKPTHRTSFILNEEFPCCYCTEVEKKGRNRRSPKYSVVGGFPAMLKNKDSAR